MSLLRSARRRLAALARWAEHNVGFLRHRLSRRRVDLTRKAVADWWDEIRRGRELRPCNVRRLEIWLRDVAEACGGEEGDVACRATLRIPGGSLELPDDGRDLHVVVEGRTTSVYDADGKLLKVITRPGDESA
jgi:hypothetical protein